MNNEKNYLIVSIKCEGCKSNCCRNPHLTPVLLPSEESNFVNQSLAIQTPFREMFVLKKKSGECTFFDPLTMKCKVYKKRPLECRLYPLLLDLIENKMDINLDKRFCPNLSSMSFQKYYIIERLKNMIYRMTGLMGIMR